MICVLFLAWHLLRTPDQLFTCHVDVQWTCSVSSSWERLGILEAASHGIANSRTSRLVHSFRSSQARRDSTDVASSIQALHWFCPTAEKQNLHAGGGNVAHVESLPAVELLKEGNLLKVEKWRPSLSASYTIYSNGGSGFPNMEMEKVVISPLFQPLLQIESIM